MLISALLFLITFRSGVSGSRLCRGDGLLELSDDLGRYLPAYPRSDVLGSCEFKDFIVEEDLVGEGTFGEVRSAYHYPSGKTVIIKELVRMQRFQSIRNEECVQHSIDHPLIAKHYCTMVSRRGTIYLILEYARGLDLFEATNRFDRIPWVSISAQLVLILEYLHGRTIIYRDLKAENVIYNPKTGMIKLIDFGLSEQFSRLAPWSVVSVGTVRCMAPEVALDKWYTFGADWYSLGVLIYEMVSGRNPFDNIPDGPELRQIVGKGFRCDLDEEDACNLVEKLARIDPKKRWGYSTGTIARIKHHPFFDGVSWDGNKLDIVYQE